MRYTLVALSLKLPNDLVEASSECAQALHISRSEYIRLAIERMNRETRATLRDEQLARASLKVREESMRINAEFDELEDGLDA